MQRAIPQMRTKIKEPPPLEPNVRQGPQQSLCIPCSMTSNNLQVPRHSELFSYVCSSIQDEEIFHFMGFELLHRLNIVQLQNELISIKEDVLRTRGAAVDTERLKKLLNDYSKEQLCNESDALKSDHRA